MYNMMILVHHQQKGYTICLHCCTFIANKSLDNNLHNHNNVLTSIQRCIESCTYFGTCYSSNWTNEKALDMMLLISYPLHVQNVNKKNADSFNYHQKEIGCKEKDILKIKSRNIDNLYCISFHKILLMIYSLSLNYFQILKRDKAIKWK